MHRYIGLIGSSSHSVVYRNTFEPRRDREVPSLGSMDNAGNSANLVSVNPRLGIGFVVAVLLFYVHGKHLWSCRDGQLT